MEWSNHRLYESRAGRRHAPTLPPSPDTSPITVHPPHRGHAVQDRLRKVEENRRKLESLGLVNVNLMKKSAPQQRVCAPHGPRPRPRPRPARVSLSKPPMMARH